MTSGSAGEPPADQAVPPRWQPNQRKRRGSGSGNSTHAEAQVAQQRDADEAADDGGKGAHVGGPCLVDLAGLNVEAGKAARGGVALRAGRGRVGGGGDTLKRARRRGGALTCGVGGRSGGRAGTSACEQRCVHTLPHTTCSSSGDGGGGRRPPAASLRQPTGPLAPPLLPPLLLHTWGQR